MQLAEDVAVWILELAGRLLLQLLFHSRSLVFLLVVLCALIVVWGIFYWITNGRDRDG